MNKKVTTSKLNKREDKSSKFMQNLNVIQMNGEINCLVNGAGLGMATVDTIAELSNYASNIIDFGSYVTNKRLVEAFKIADSDSNVKGMYINFFCGIVQGDVAAEGIIKALKKAKRKLPVVVRLEGTNASKGKKILLNSSCNVIIAESMVDGVKKIISQIEPHLESEK